MIFGGVLASYPDAPLAHPDRAANADSRQHLGGRLQHLVLLSSSLSAVLAHPGGGARAKARRRRAPVLHRPGALVFVTVKGLEWNHEIHGLRAPDAEDFGPSIWRRDHIHVIAGMRSSWCLIAGYETERGAPGWSENIGLYWHFVDIVWIFLPLLYIAK